MPARNREPLTEELAYLAGIIDGEGCIGAARLQDKRRGRYGSVMFTVRIGMNDRQPLDLFAELYGGRVMAFADKRAAPRKAHFVWQAYSGRGGNLLEDVLPYLRIKHGQAEAFLESRNTFTGGPRKGFKGSQSPSAQDIMLRELCCQRIRQLNKRLIYAS